MLLPNFFQNFSKQFQILKNQKAYRVQVHPGAKVNFRYVFCKKKSFKGDNKKSLQFFL